MKKALVTLVVLLLLAVTAVAKQRSVTAPTPEGDARVKGSGASVTGEVTSVSGNLISIAGGLVTIDASQAKILSGRDGATVAAITPGMLILATVTDGGTVSTAPLVASTIAVLHSADVSMIGLVQSVDTAGSQFLMLSRTMKVNASTSFENFGTGATLASLQTNMLVAVEANVAGSSLVASRVRLIAPVPPRPEIASGVLKSIGADAWVVTVRDHDVTFVVNAHTKIIGSPKAGDRVDVLYMVDNAHTNVALSIIKSVELPKYVTLIGTIKSYDPPRWVITLEDGKDVVVIWPESVRISPAYTIGDKVRITALENPDGTYTLVKITKG
jgi:hypothetical protein